MALGGTPSSSFAPPAPTASSTDSGSDDGDDSTAFDFSSNTLTFVFLSVGLLCALVIFYAGWRRVRYGRGGLMFAGRLGWAPMYGYGPPRGSPEALGPIPKFWDCWTSGSETGEKAVWTAIMVRA